MKLGILAVQGAFAEHAAVLGRLDVPCKEIRQRGDLKEPLDGLILPGGESTVQGKLLRALGLFEPMREMIQSGLPVLATCAGMILLAGEIEGQSTRHFATMPMTVRRNAYGRQLGSFHAEAEFANVGKIPMTFIRAPYVTWVGEGALTLAKVDGHVVAVRFKNQVALSFHPELDGDLRLHRRFVGMCRERTAQTERQAVR